MIQKELGIIIAKGIEFPVGSLATINEVEISDDFKKAVIWVGVIPEEVSGRVLEILTRARGYLQYHLGEKVRARIIPRIEFAIDRGAGYSARIEKISLEKDKQ